MIQKLKKKEIKEHRLEIDPKNEYLWISDEKELEIFEYLGWEAIYQEIK